MREQNKTGQVMAVIRRQIAARALTPGMKLPSVRLQARLSDVSTSTIVEAYARLAAENVITSRPGAGFYVAGPIAPLDLTHMTPVKERDIDPLWISRQALDAEDGKLKPGCGWLPSDWMYEEGMRRALRKMAREPASTLADYATSANSLPLRQLLVRRMANQDIKTQADQVMLTESGTQAIDLICRFLLQPGDTVLVDDPCYFNFHALLRAHRVNIVSVPYTANGPDLAAFAAVLQAHSPRLYITNSAIHNPTGAVLSPLVAHRVLKMAEQHDLIIVEDDIFADFEHRPAPRLAAFDGLSRVIAIGSFSKTVSAALRCGYIAARDEWVEALIDLKIATSFGGGRLAAEMMLQVLTDSGYRRHLEGLKLRLAQAMKNTHGRLQQLGIRPWLTPPAGLFLWCQLPDNIDAVELARRCLRDDVVLAPGNIFSQSGSASTLMRFNVSQCSDERIYRSLQQALRDQLR